MFFVVVAAVAVVTVVVVVVVVTVVVAVVIVFVVVVSVVVVNLGDRRSSSNSWLSTAGLADHACLLRRPLHLDKRMLVANTVTFLSTFSCSQKCIFYFLLSKKS